MNKSIRMTFLIITFSLLSACTMETRTNDTILRISYTPSYNEHWDWAATTLMIFHFHQLSHYSQDDIIYYYDHHYGYDHVSINDISWLLWDIAGIDSYLTGTLSFREIRAHINTGQPILLFYGDNYDGHYVLLHGYDDNGYLYIHDPDFGTRVIHYDALYTMHANSINYYWTASLLIQN